MKKITLFLLTCVACSTIMLTSCKKNESDGSSNTDGGISGDVDVIELMNNVGFVSMNEDYNTLYGGGAVNDFLLRLDENAAGDDISRLELIVRNGNKSDTLDLTAIGSSPKDITVEKYVRHFQVEVADIANANDVNTEIYAFDENDKQLGKIKFTVNTKASKPAGIQLLQFPTSGFYNVSNEYSPYKDNTFPFIGALDEEGSSGDQYFLAVRVFGGNKNFSGWGTSLSYYDVNDNPQPILIQLSPGDVQGENKNNAFFIFLDDDGDENTLDSSLTIDSDTHFIDHDQNEGTARIAKYRIRYTNLIDYYDYEFQITEK